MSDDKQYNFMVHRLLAAGKTPENSPRIFDGIERLRKSHQTNRPSALPDGEKLGSIASALTVEPCAQLFNMSVTTNATQSQLDAQSTVTCFDGAAFPYAYIDVVVHETDAKKSYLIAKTYQYAESYMGAANLQTATASSALQVDVGKYHYADSISYEEDADGNAVTGYASQLIAAVSRPAGVLLLHPREINGGAPIRICIKRAAWAGAGDCDYAAVDQSGDPSQWGVGMAAMVRDSSGFWRADTRPDYRWFPVPSFNQFQNLYVPLAGKFDAGTDQNGSPCIINNIVTARATLTMQIRGGWCDTRGGVSDDIYNNIITQISGQTADFNVLGNFGQDCLPLANNSYATEPVSLRITIAANTTCGPRTAFVRDTTVGTLDFKDSCFAQGTGILRADGQYVAVEKIKIGEKVIVNEEGRTLTVVSMSRGGERNPLVQIIDDMRHSVLLTQKHPVVTTGGILQAEQIEEGTVVETENGLHTVVDVTRIPYDGAVYNLTLGTPAELAQTRGDDRTMFAGGIRVGDNQMQFEMQQPSSMQTSAVSPAWRKDHDNAVARGANVMVAR